MDLEKKVKKALAKALSPERVDLEDHDGISGYVVATRFRKMEFIDRQELIDKALHAPSAKLTPEELRQVLAIAALTPEEYVAHGIAD